MEEGVTSNQSIQTPSKQTTMIKRSTGTLRGIAPIPHNDDDGTTQHHTKSTPKVSENVEDKH